MIPENRRYSNFRKEATLKKLVTIFGLAIVVFSWVGAAKSDSPLTVVDVVDLNRYLGMWYEIASYPSWFQKGCTGSTAEYSLLSDGKIQDTCPLTRKRMETIDQEFTDSALKFMEKAHAGGGGRLYETPSGRVWDHDLVLRRS